VQVRGNYSSPDAEGPAVDIGGSVREEKIWDCRKDLKDNYDPSKKISRIQKIYKKNTRTAVR
jgi:hypothetical protein